MTDDAVRLVLAIVLILLLGIFLIPIVMMLFMGFRFSMPMSPWMMDEGPHMFGMFIPFWSVFLILLVLLAGVIYLLSTDRGRGLYTREGGRVVVESTPEEASKASDEGGEEEPEIMRVLKPDERRVVELLIENGGVMLQKDLRWELGMNRVKIHRILERLEERNIIVRRSVGNTNEVRLADWLMERYNKK